VAVALRCETGRARPYAARLRVDARRLMALVGVAACELSIVIADDVFVGALNREFRGKDRPTDVLSFSQLEEADQRRAALPRGADPAFAAARRRRGAPPAPLPSPLPVGLLPPPTQAGTLLPAAGTALGDVVISLDTARRQARRLGVAPAARMRTLLVHGLLHLLGYDHERSPAEARRMFARERELAAALRRAAGGGGSRRQPRKRARKGTGAAAPVPSRAKRREDSDR
jgi:rRNA maturation RNase YbeY